MTKRINLFSIIAMIAVIALCMTACDLEDPGNDDVPKTLVITGIGTQETSVLTVGIADVSTSGKKTKTDLLAYGQVQALGTPPSYGDSVEIPLASNTTGGLPYTGTGSYYIILIFDGPNSSITTDDITYMYTGSTSSTLITKLSITQAVTTVPFNYFKQQD
jgi:hypothetical protein